MKGVNVAELTNLESKLGEVLGLAMAAQGATEQVGKLVEEEDDRDLLQALERMRKEAAETEERCTERAERFEGKKTAVLEKAREVKQEATEMMRTYLGEDADALDGFEFLTMAEAGEVGHWSVLQELNKQTKHPGVTKLVGTHLPIQKRHLKDVMAASLQLAAKEDANAEA